MHYTVDVFMKKVFDAHLHYCTWADQLYYIDTAARLIPNAPSSLHMRCNTTDIYLSGKSPIDL